MKLPFQFHVRFGHSYDRFYSDPEFIVTDEVAFKKFRRRFIIGAIIVMLLMSGGYLFSRAIAYHLGWLDWIALGAVSLLIAQRSFFCVDEVRKAIAEQRATS